MALADITQTLVFSKSSRGKRVLQILGWSGFALGTLLLFTVFKLPQDRIKGLMLGQLSNTLANYGFGLTADSSDLSFGFGISYELKGVNLLPPGGLPAIRLESLRVEPQLLKALTGKMGAELTLTQKRGSVLELNASIKGNSIDVEGDLQKIDLGALQVLPLLTQMYGGLRADALASGTFEIAGDLSSPTTLQGEFDLSVKQLVLEPQTIFGFNLPRIAVSEGIFKGAMQKSRLTLQTVQLGRPGSPDDLIAIVTGDALLGQTWETSSANYKANIRFSQNVMKAFLFLESVLAGAKRADGSYGFQITGPLLGATAIPQPN